MNPDHRSSVGAVVLAAGSGSRFGGAKLLAPFGGRPLLAHSCDAVRRAREAALVGPGWVVVAAKDGAGRSLVEQAGLMPLLNPRPEGGISTSIRLALDAAAGAAELGAVLLLLGDQPSVRVETMRRLVEAWHDGDGPVIRPRYSDQPDAPGHPILLSRAVWPLTERARGDRGLARVLPPATLIDIRGANPDVDTRADLRQLEDPGR
jgi:molybdenum cofactor cytidylyltransferase